LASHPGQSDADLPREQYSLAIVSGQDYFFIKGVVEAIAERLGLPQTVRYEPSACAGLDPNWSAKIMLGDRMVGHQGLVDSKLLRELKLPGNAVAVELSLVALLDDAKLVPTQKQVSPYPAIIRDLNLIVAEEIRWSSLENAVRVAVGSELESVHYRETYRDAKRDGEGRKRILLSVSLRKPDTTLTHAEADSLVKSILASCEKEVGARLLG
jgi:phenylalanyl-tRNA synthetase beta chain